MSSNEMFWIDENGRKTDEGLYDEMLKQGDAKPLSPARRADLAAILDRAGVDPDPELRRRLWGL